MTILLILGGALVILAVVLVSAAAGTTESGHAVSGVDRSVAARQAMTNAPKELNSEYDEPFADRVIAPFQPGRWPSAAGSRAPTPPNGSAASSTSPATPTGLDRRPGPVRQGDRRDALFLISLALQLSWGRLHDALS